MAKQQSQAPKERINITYRPATNTKEQKELPFRLAMLGDFTLKPDETPLEERKPLRVDKDNFNDVMRSQKLNVAVNVKNKLTGGKDDELSAKLDFATLKDFEPEQIARSVPEMNKLLETREALSALKAPLANKREFAKKLRELVQDEDTRKKLLDALGMDAPGGGGSAGGAAEGGDAGPGDAGG
ncbi:MAG: type VI secretion system contractile sheath small subunit [Planctomycetes bacterium]|nr:type VI secretion system contractile sheath small subunit [Planctomycetota bacterium]